VYIGDISVLNERVLGFLRLKHILYLFHVGMLLWYGYKIGKPGVLILGLVAGILTILSALFSRGSMSFEARLLAFTVSAISSVGSSKKRTEKKRSEAEGY
jgi:hypothetical protein